MLQTTLAYILTFFLAPAVGAIASLLCMPLIFLTKREGLREAGDLKIRSYDLIAGMVSGVGAFIAVWFGTLLFSWFDKKPSIGMVVMLGLGYVLNDLRRIRHSAPGLLATEITRIHGDVIGLVIGGAKLLP